MSDLPLIAIKGRFRSPEQKMFGLFVLILNQEAGFIDTAAIVVSIHSDVYDLAPQESWSKYEGKIQRLKYEGQYSQTTTIDLQESLKNLTMDQEFYNDLHRSVQGNDIGGIQHTMGTLINRVLHDQRTSMEIATEEVTQEQLKSEEAIADQAIETGTTAPASEGVVLNVSLVIAPVGGKSVNDLEVGDKIMVRLQTNSDKAEYFIDLLGLRTEKGVKPTMGEIQSIDVSGKTTEIKVKLDENVYGRVIEEEKVLVRMFDPKVDAPPPKKTKEQADSPGATAARSSSSKAPMGAEKKSGMMFKIFISLAVVLFFFVAYLLLAP